MELQGLPAALSRRFPAHDFFPVARSAEEPFAGFTSGSLPTPTNASALPALTRIVQRAAALADDPRVSFVLILDDLELENAHQPALVTQTVRQAFEAHLRGLSEQGRPASEVAQVRQAVQDKVSFHLAVLMVESWLFADPRGAERAGALPGRLPPQLSPGLDPESLRLVDPAYLADRGADCACWRELSVKKQNEHRPMWLKPLLFPRRSEHAKAAMAWLCLDPEEKKCSSYKETKGGAAALAQLDWEAVLDNPAHLRFLRAMNNDLSLFFNDPVTFSEGTEPPETQLKIRDPSRVLRNL